MRISYFHRDEAFVFESEMPQVVVGRPRTGVSPAPDLDLSPDLTVSRPHARIWIDARERHWIEDLGSTHGTQVNGVEIKGRGPHRLQTGDSIRTGETMLLVEVPPAGPDAAASGAASGGQDEVAPGNSPATAPPGGSARPSGATRGAPTAEPSPAPPLPGPAGEPEVRIAECLDAGTSGAVLLESVTSDSARRVALLYDLLLQYGSGTGLDALLQTIVERLVEAIPDAVRGALLLRGRDDDTLLLKAYRSPEGPVVSETLARRAMRERIGFIWRRGEEGDVGRSIVEYRIESGMYAPLVWQGLVLGVVAVDNPMGSTAFTEADLRLLLTVANYIAMALANQRLQEELRRESAVKANLLRQFSPRVAEQLLSHGSLKLSGERGEVTILCSDIRNFTSLARQMQPLEVVQLLNDYFSRLIPIIFAHGGTVDKFIGDAILTVFGGPESETRQHEDAVRAALDMQAAMTEFNLERTAQTKVTCQVGIGVHCGEVLQGFIGVLDRMEFAVIGDAVNRATRYCDVAGPGEVLISPQVYQWVWKIVEAEQVTRRTKHDEDLPAFRVSSVRAYQHALPEPRTAS